MRTARVFMALLVALVFALPPAALADDSQIKQLKQEIMLLKARLAEMEKRLDAASSRVGSAHQSATQALKKAEEAQAGSIKASRLVTQGKDEGVFSEIGKRIDVTGALEFEFAYEKKKSGGATTNSSGLSLATAEVFFTGHVNKYTKGVLHFIWEDGDTAVRLDEGFILLGQTDDMPFYALAGLVYAPIGLFQTHMVSDPIIQNTFETNVKALEAGYAGGMFKFSLGAYNSDTQQASDSDDVINTFYLRADFTPKIGSVGLHFGAMYTNNIASGNGLGDWVNGGALQDLVGGYSLFAMAKHEKFAVSFEYIRAADNFQAGELSIATAGDKPEPAAWNLELAFFPVDKWTVAVRYEGSQDLYGEEPESQYGGTVSYEILKDTTLSLEYLYGDYQNGDTRHLITSQLAVVF